MSKSPEIKKALQKKRRDSASWEWDSRKEPVKNGRGTIWKQLYYCVIGTWRPKAREFIVDPPLRARKSKKSRKSEKIRIQFDSDASSQFLWSGEAFSADRFIVLQTQSARSISSCSDRLMKSWLTWKQQQQKIKSYSFLRRPPKAATAKN